MIKSDVAIIGAGPAGLTCARLAAAAGLSVIVLEAQSFPLRKTCAGGLTEKAIRLLPDGAQRAVCQSLTASIYRVSGQSPLRFTCETPHAHSIDRGELSVALAEAAEAEGARIAPGSAVMAARRAGHWTDISARRITSIRARIVVGCYGAQPTARINLIDQWPGPARPAVAGFIPSHSLASLHENWQTVDCMLFDTGLLSFAFPMHSGYQVGVLQFRPTSTTSAVLAHLREAAHFYASKVLGISQAGSFSAGWLPVPCGRRPLSVTGQMLAGDAAGLCDPLFGEGVYFALRSGVLVAQCAVEALSSGDLSLRTYSALIGQEFQPAFRWQRLGRCLLTRWPALASRLLTDCPHTHSKLLDYMDDFQSWRGFRLLPILCLPHLSGFSMATRTFSGRSPMEVTVERLHSTGWALR